MEALWGSVEDPVLSLLLLAVAVLGGAGLVSLWDRDATLPARLAAGAPVGIALLGLVGFVAGLLLGLTPIALAITGLVVALPAGLLRTGRAPRRLALRALRRFAAAVGAAILLWAVFSRVLIVSNGGIATGDDHNLGDLPFHLAIITRFADGGNFPPEHPELSGVRLTYPFLVDLVAAMEVRAGASLRSALLGENIVLGLALVAILHRFGLRLTRDPRAARLTPVLVLLSGGLGFWRFFAEAGRGVAGHLFGLGHDYTITWDGELRWGNALVALFVPQRTLLLGVPLALVVWTLWWRGAVEDAEPDRRRRFMLAAGGVAGLLPLAHAHSYAVVLGMGACLALLFPRRGWNAFFTPAVLLGGPQVLWMAHGSSIRASDFLAWQVGWDHGERDPVWFWIENTGLFLPLLAVAFVRRRPARLLRFAAPFLLLFVAPNLLRLSPWIWDNIKFLFFWFLAGVPLVALLLARLSRRGLLGALGAAACVLALTLSGGLDVWRMASGQIENRIFDADAVAFAHRIREATPPGALVLHAPAYDSPVYLSGRRSLLGYEGHIGSQGLDAGSRADDIRRIYAGAPDAGPLLRRYGVDFLVIGPLERSRLAPDLAFLDGFPLVTEIGAYQLRQVAGPVVRTAVPSPYVGRDRVGGR